MTSAQSRILTIAWLGVLAIFAWSAWESIKTSRKTGETSDLYASLLQTEIKRQEGTA